MGFACKPSIHFIAALATVPVLLLQLLQGGAIIFILHFQFALE
jgi:hypothetical protein